MAVAPEELQPHKGPLSSTTPIGTLIVGGVVCVAFSESRAAPLVATFLAAALAYQGLKLYGQLHG